MSKAFLFVGLLASASAAATSPKATCPCDESYPCYKYSAYGPAGNPDAWTKPEIGTHCLPRETLSGACPADTAYGCWGAQVPNSHSSGWELYGGSASDPWRIFSTPSRGLWAFPRAQLIFMESPHALWSNQHVQRSPVLSPRCDAGSGSGRRICTPGRLPGVERSTRGSKITIAG